MKINGDMSAPAQAKKPKLEDGIENNGTTSAAGKNTMHFSCFYIIQVA